MLLIKIQGNVVLVSLKTKNKHQLGAMATVETKGEVTESLRTTGEDSTM